MVWHATLIRMNKSTHYKECIDAARAQGRAIGHFNFSNFETARAVVHAARELQLPVILGLSEGERSHVGLKSARMMVDALLQETDQPVFLNADHTYTLDGVKEAVDSGVDSVIVDGSNLSFEENVALTKSAVEYVRTHTEGVLVEGELGFIGTSSQILDSLPEGVAQGDTLTRVEDARRFVEETGIDMLAPAVGTIHGMLRSGHNPKIHSERIQELTGALSLPLVLHGGSGSSNEDFVAAIHAGIAIVHINTEIRIALKRGITSYISAHPDEIAPYKYLRSGEEAVRSVVQDRLALFNNLSRILLRSKLMI